MCVPQCEYVVLCGYTCLCLCVYAIWEEAAVLPLSVCVCLVTAGTEAFPRVLVLFSSPLQQPDIQKTFFSIYQPTTLLHDSFLLVAQTDVEFPTFVQPLVPLQLLVPLLAYISRNEEVTVYWNQVLSFANNKCEISTLNTSQHETAVQNAIQFGLKRTSTGKN